MQTWEQPPLLIMHSFSPERRKEKRRPPVRKEMDAQTPPNQSRHTMCTSLDCRGKSEHRPHADRETKCKLQSRARQSNSQPTVLATTKKKNMSTAAKTTRASDTNVFPLDPRAEMDNQEGCCIYARPVDGGVAKSLFLWRACAVHNQKSLPITVVQQHFDRIES